MSPNQFLTVKCPIQSAVKDPKMRAAIERRVKLVSMMMHRGSHAVLLTVVHCYTNNLPFPDIKVGNQYATNLLNHVEMYGLLPYASTLLIILWWM